MLTDTVKLKEIKLLNCYVSQRWATEDGLSLSNNS